MIEREILFLLSLLRGGKISESQKVFEMKLAKLKEDTPEEKKQQLE